MSRPRERMMTARSPYAVPIPFVPTRPATPAYTRVPFGMSRSRPWWNPFRPPPRGDGRERLWRSIGTALQVGVVPEDRPDVREAKNVLIRALRRDAHDEVERALSAVEQEPEEWRDATTYSDWVLRLTPRRALAVIEMLIATIGEIDEEYEDDAAPFVLQLNAYPYPGKVGDQGDRKGDGQGAGKVGEP